MNRLLRVALSAALGVVITVTMVLAFVRDDGSPIVLTPARSDATIAVHIAGAVATPGLVLVPSGARLADVLAAAGGLRTDADVGGLNVAARVADAQRIIIPAISALPATPPISPSSVAQAAGAPSPRSSSSSGGRINLNTADAALLETLPGIGPVLAQRIIDHREQMGPFESVDDLEAINGISARLVDELRPLVTVDG